MPGDLPSKEAGELLLSGRAYAQLPNEVYLVFLKIDRRVSDGALTLSSMNNIISRVENSAHSKPVTDEAHVDPVYSWS